MGGFGLPTASRTGSTVNLGSLSESSVFSRIVRKGNGFVQKNVTSTNVMVNTISLPKANRGRGRLPAENDSSKGYGDVIPSGFAAERFACYDGKKNIDTIVSYVQDILEQYGVGQIGERGRKTSFR